MTPFSIALAVGILLFAPLIYIYFGMPRLTLATLLTPIFALFLIWTAFGFPVHFGIGHLYYDDFCVDCGNYSADGNFSDPYHLCCNRPSDFDSWCKCGNCTELASRLGNSSYNDFYKDLCIDHCCKGNFIFKDHYIYGNITLPNPIID